MIDSETTISEATDGMMISEEIEEVMTSEEIEEVMITLEMTETRTSAMTDSEINLSHK
jgi:predicted house-cleaning noncanonical NTP pyrophosphatase (MazG superfamily)